MIVKSSWNGKSFHDTEIKEECIIFHADGYVTKNKFMTWEPVEIRTDRINSDSTLALVMYSYYYETQKRDEKFYVTINDANKIIEFYEQRNKEIISCKNQILKQVTKRLIEISRNIVVLSDEMLLNRRLLFYFYAQYYLGQDVGVTYVMEQLNVYKGKAKKDAEQRNTQLCSNIHSVNSLLSNFVELIQEEIVVKPYLAKAIAWVLVQESAIKYYSEIWEKEYEFRLDSTYIEIKKREKSHLCEPLSLKEKENIQRKYIQQVILCDDIDLDYVKNIFYYFLAIKNDINSMANLFKEFNDYDALVKSVKAEMKATDIKQLLTTTQERKPSNYTIDDIDLMNGSEFEAFVALLFEKMGYSTKVTKKSGDQGLDVIAAKNGIKIGIQVKCYSNTVGNAAIQEAVAGKSYYGCEKVMVVTNNYFTNAAMELARSNNVILWNRDIIKEKLKELF